ncbi:MAG: TonB-dependent receptor [Ferruginibacter sp.]|nr:TonB-dependent receptor [Ferruginibacter sp.]
MIDMNVTFKKGFLSTLIIGTLILFLAPGQIFSQSLKVIQGTVYNNNGSTPLADASVTIKGTNKGVTTNAKGKFSIKADNSDVLVFTSVGFATQEKPVGDQAAMDVILQGSSAVLNEVIVNVGYGTQRKATLTGSVASVSGKELQMSPAISVSNSIAGMLPGVIALNRTGEPGLDEAEILIRGRNTTGNNSPLVVVDGVQDAPGWQQINPGDIESISVLKDASASIYGARAANGVILITTKRGITGKPIISYSFNQGLSQPTRLPKMADAASLATYTNELLVKSGSSPRFTQDEIRKFADGSDPVNYPNINWYDELLKSTTTQSRHNLSVRGGSENIKYLVSGSFANQDGIFKNGNNNYKTYSVRANLDAQINKFIKVGFDINSGLNVRNAPYPASTSIFAFLRYQLSYIPPFYENGLPTQGVNANNPAIMATAAAGYNNTRVQQNLVKASFDIKIPWVDGLGVDGYFAYNNSNTEAKTWALPYTVYNHDKITDTYIPVQNGTLPNLTQSYGNGRNTLVNLRIKYEKQLNDHRISTFIAVEQQSGSNNSFLAYRNNFISSSIDQLFAGSLLNQQTDGTASSTGRKNFFGRVSYGFKNKYLLDFNYRYDGSASFPEGKRYGFFPGLSAAWRISQEKFIEDNFSFIDDLKLRGSYGKIGNDQIAPFQYLTLYTLNRLGYNFGQTPAPTQGLIANVAPNPNVTWEVATISNIGVDGSLWKGLLSFSIDVFKQRRSNILATRNLAVPSFTGLILPNENIGIVENKGVELQLTHRETIGKFSYRIGANVAYVKNNVIDISEASNVPSWQKAEGHVIGAAVYYKSLGIFRTQDEINKSPVLSGTVVGDLKYEDVNGDGKISAADMVRMDKTNTPEITFGFNWSLNYKNFSLFANFAGQANAWQNFNLHAKLDQNSYAELIDNRYTPGSMTSKYPILATSGTQNQVSSFPSDFWFKDASFIRLKTLEIGYDLSKNLLTKFKINSLKIFVNGNNLLLIDKMKFVDPETNENTGNFYPQNKVYNVGINLNF